MVRLTRIYTRLGDSGNTHLGDMSRVSKNHPLIEAYGTVDELNAQLGVILTVTDISLEMKEWIRHIQNDLFDLGADLSVPLQESESKENLDHSPSTEDDSSTSEKQTERTRLRIKPEQIDWLEQICDQVNSTLEPLKSFLLPGGTPLGAQLHVARTVCRRAERRTLQCEDEINPNCVKYLNRLSDLLFILSRSVNVGEEPLWEPGRYR